MSNDTSVFDAALRYRELGWSVVPVVGKRASVEWKPFQTERPSEHQIREWFDGTTATGIAVVCGEVSRLVVIDYDPRNDPNDEGAAWLARAELPNTATVLTGRGDGGFHTYLRTPEGFNAPTGKLEPASGVEIRFTGHYCVAPPSLHPDTGGVYIWQDGLPTLSDLADSPSWLLDALRPAPDSSDQRGTTTLPARRGAVVRRLVADAVRDFQIVEKIASPAGTTTDDPASFWTAKALERAGAGNRNETGLWLACQLRDAEVSETAARTALLAYAGRVRGLGEQAYTDDEAVASLAQAFNAPARGPAEAQVVKRVEIPRTEAKTSPTANPPGDRPAEEDLVTLSMKDIAEFYGSVRWAWNRFVPYGHLTLIVGATGIGKSHFAAGIIAAFTGNGAFPTGEPSETPGRVLLVETEEFRGVYAQRLRALGVPDELVVIPTEGGNPTWVADLNGDGDRLARVAERERCVAIVIDSLSGGHRQDENSSEMRETMSRLAQLASKLDCPVIAVHHLRKRNVQEPVGLTLDRIRGSSTIAQFARSVFGLSVPDKDTGTVRVDVLKSSFAPTPPSFGFDILQTGIEYTVAPEAMKPPTALDNATKWLRSTLADGAMSPKDVESFAKDAGIPRATLFRAKKALGLVTVDGMWTLRSINAETPDT
jgi:archaellum biogenesis ATPase FlaH